MVDDDAQRAVGELRGAGSQVLLRPLAAAPGAPRRRRATQPSSHSRDEGAGRAAPSRQGESGDAHRPARGAEEVDHGGDGIRSEQAPAVRDAALVVVEGRLEDAVAGVDGLEPHPAGDAEAEQRGRARRDAGARRSPRPRRG